MAFQPKECHHVAGNVVKEAGGGGRDLPRFSFFGYTHGNGVWCYVLHARHG